ncbi:MAG: MFS transporter [Acidimicrobiales bacterium]
MSLGPNYRRLWTASGFSNLADGVFQIALPLLALTFTRSPALIAGVALAARLPWLLFALQAGALADRLDRRRTMVLVAVARAALIGMIGVLVMFDAARLWMLYVIAFALGIGETLFDTAAQSIMPMIVKHDDLSRANGRLYAVELTMNQFIGPPLGGILVGTAMALAFVGSALAYLVGFLALVAMVGSFKVDRVGPPAKLRTDITEGLRFLFHHRVLRTFAVMTGVANLANTGAFALLPIYAVAPGPLGLTEAGFGVLTVPMAVGSVVGSFAAARIERALGKVNTVVLAGAAIAATTAVPAIWPEVVPVMVGFFVGGFAIVVWNVVTVSLRQRITPPHLLGRMNASYRLLAWGSMPLGALIGGALAEWIGVRATFVVMAAIQMLIVLARLVVSDGDIDAAEREVTEHEPKEPVAAS